MKPGPVARVVVTRCLQQGVDSDWVTDAGSGSSMEMIPGGTADQDRNDIAWSGLVEVATLILMCWRFEAEVCAANSGRECLTRGDVRRARNGLAEHKKGQ